MFGPMEPAVCREAKKEAHGLVSPSPPTSANLISTASAMDANGDPTRLNDIALCGSLPVSTP
jgi:hypothetical protein